MEARSDQVYSEAVGKAKLMQNCCEEFYVEETVCITELPENYLQDYLNKYPSGLTEEVEEGEDFTAVKYIYISEGKLKTLEKKIWTWGGELFYKNSICPLTKEKFMEELAGLKGN